MTYVLPKSVDGELERAGNPGRTDPCNAAQAPLATGVPDQHPIQSHDHAAGGQPAVVEALEEVTALEVDREHLVDLVMRKPLLLQELGRTIDERRARVQQLTVP
ncbi:MAG: hypothetical protein JOZ00_14890 [Mycobacterium sp.]|nr:hypothetical protein [Mycobacterium sp.]